MKTFNNLEELKPYYNKQTNTYDFMGNGELFCVDFTFSLVIKANINAWDINAENINAWDINAWNINAWDINAENINAEKIIFWGVCVAYDNIKCTSIKGRRNNAKYFCLDSEVIVKNAKKE